MKIPEKMKWKSEPINISKTKWAYRDDKFFTIVEEQERRGTVQIKVSLKNLKKILEAK